MEVLGTIGDHYSCLLRYDNYSNIEIMSLKIKWDWLLE